MADTFKDLVNLLPSQTRNADFTSDSIECPQSRGIFVFLDITAVPGTPAGLSLRIQTQDPSSLKWTSLNAAPTAVTTTGTTTYAICPSGGTGSAVTQLTNGLSLPGRFRLFISHNADSGNYTYSVGYSTTN